MRKVLYLLIAMTLLIIVVFFITPFFKKQNPELPKLKIIPTQKPLRKTTSIFIPEWTIQSESVKSVIGDQLNQYDRIIYFGSNKAKIQEFDNITSNHKNKWLTVIMTNYDTNIEILKNPSGWSKTIDQNIKIAQENNFNGIVLDLEMSTIPFNRIVNDIVDFNKSFYQAAKKAKLAYGFLAYGDTFYRNRPYYLPEINKFADEIMIMAYDLHKSRGEPGPNFPLEGKEKYGYDFVTMISDFKKDVPPDKLTVIFGMYGLDWQVDERRLPINQAKALTLSEIKKQFLEKCQWKDCLIKRDDLSSETEINYVKSQVVNEFGYLDYHIVWYEDEQSVRLKKTFLETAGIGSIGYFAYSYF